MPITQIDIISRHNYLYYHGNTRHKSAVGALLTILAYAIIIVISIFFSFDLFIRRHPNVVHYYKYISPDEQILINKASFFHFVQILSFNDKSINSSLFSIIGTNHKFEKLINTNLNEINFWKYDSCEEEDFSSYKDIIVDKHYINSLCIKQFYNVTTKQFYSVNEEGFTYPSITNDGESRSLYGVYLIKCSQQLNQSCLEEENEREGGAVSYMNIYSINKDFDVLENKNELTEHIAEIKVKVNPTTIHSQVARFSLTEVFTDDSYFFHNKREKKYYSFRLSETGKEYQRDADLRFVCYGYFGVEPKEEIYYRTYDKFFIVLSRIGGASVIVIFLAKVMNYYINSYIIMSDIQSTWESLSSFGSFDDLAPRKTKKNLSVSATNNFNNSINTLILQNRVTKHPVIHNTTTMGKTVLPPVTLAKKSVKSFFSYCCNTLGNPKSPSRTDKVIHQIKHHWKSRLSEEGMLKISMYVSSKIKEEVKRKFSIANKVYKY